MTPDGTDKGKVMFDINGGQFTMSGTGDEEIVRPSANGHSPTGSQARHCAWPFFFTLFKTASRQVLRQQRPFGAASGRAWRDAPTPRAPCVINDAANSISALGAPVIAIAFLTQL